jgi:hypothetical protein
MPRLESERFFGGGIPRDLWNDYEMWTQGKKFTNTQLQTALFRLFLAVPDEWKQWALFGNDKTKPSQQPYDEDMFRRKVIEIVRESQAIFQTNPDDQDSSAQAAG